MTRSDTLRQLLADRVTLARALGGEAAAALEQRGRLAVDHVVVISLADARVMRIEQLQDLARGDGIGGFRKNAHDVHAVELDHHLE